MNLDIEQYRGCLSHRAFPAHSSLGRKHQLLELEPELDLVNPYLRDEVAIFESKSLRRLGSKTQVFVDPKNPHVRHRSDHSHEAAASAIWISALTGLNIELCRVIALGHDLGHSPYGHLGEATISEITGKEFKHEIFGIVVVQQIERQGEGLNLSYEVLAGMRWHSGISELPPNLNLPLECMIGNFADKISYLFADVNDVKRLEFPDAEKVEQVEQEANFFGKNHRQRTQNCFHALVKESAEEGTLSFSKSEIAQKFKEFREWMYKEVYEQLNEIRLSLRSALMDTYGFLSRYPYFEGCDPALLLALMTDREIDDLPAIIKNKRYPKLEEISHLGIVEIMPYLRGKKIDFTHIDLNPANFRRDFACS